MRTGQQAISAVAFRARRPEPRRRRLRSRRPHLARVFAARLGGAVSYLAHDQAVTAAALSATAVDRDR